MTLLIKRIDIPQPESLEAEKIMCQVMGKPFPEHKTVTYYRHAKTGREYLYIIGAFALPGFDRPGFALVAGYDRHEHPTHKRHLIHILDEFEASGSSLKSIFRGVKKFCRKYGAQPLLNGWYVDAKEMDMLNLSDLMHRKRMPFWPEVGPYGLLGSPASEYLRTLIENIALLDRGDCNKLRGHMERGPQTDEEGRAFRKEKNPALSAISLAVTTLVLWRPWTWDAEAQPMPITPEAPDDVNSYVTFDDAGFEY